MTINTKLNRPSCGALIRALPAGAKIINRHGKHCDPATWIASAPAFVKDWTVAYNQTGTILTFAFPCYVALGAVTVVLPDENQA